MLIAFLAAAAAGQPIESCPVQASALRRAADRIEQHYLDARKGRDIAVQVRAWAAAGRYADVCSSEAVFLERLNADLDAYDGHFHFEAISRDASADDWLMAWRTGGPASNMGVREVRVLEGNIGYLRLGSFYPWDMARAKLQAAWSLLADTDAMIIDLRQNGGGDSETAEQIVRSALGDVSEVQRFERRSVYEPDPLPQAELPVIRSDLPMAVLVDRRSASASEYVAYSLQAARRAIVVGSRSAGAASLLGEPIRLGPDYQISIPDARPVNLVTGSNWEGSGVRPDVAGGDDPLFIARAELVRARSLGSGEAARAR